MLPVLDCSRVRWRTAGLVFVTWSGHALAGSRSANTFHPRKGKPIARWGRKATGLRSPLFSQDRRSPGCRRGGVVTTPFIPGPASAKSFTDAVLLHCGTGSHRPRQGCPATSSSPTTPKPSTAWCQKKRTGTQKKFLGRFDVTSPHTQGSAAKPASPWAIHCRPVRGSEPCQRPNTHVYFKLLNFQL